MKNKNILIHGAIGGSNFGDCLFAHIFYDYFSKNNNVFFNTSSKYGISEFLLKEINYNKKSIKKKNIDCLVYMSGGYLGDSENSLIQSIYRYFRYFFLGEYFLFKNKEIYFCGVGGGPIFNNLLRKKIVKLMNASKKITVRDIETKDYFVKYGVKNNIEVTTDTALLLNNMVLPDLDEKISNQIAKYDKNKKIIFFHVYGNNELNIEIEEKIVPALNKFLLEHKEYICIVGNDSLSNNKIKDLSVFQKIHGDKIAYDYYNTFQLCALLKRVDSVITVKLHVGIVSSTFGKGIISLPKHKYKTLRFYKQIGEENRCKLLSEINSEIVYNMMSTFLEKKVLISNELIEKSKQNLNI